MTLERQTTTINTLANAILGKNREKRWKRLIALGIVGILGYWLIFCVSFGIGSDGFWFKSEKKRNAETKAVEVVAPR